MEALCAAFRSLLRSRSKHTTRDTAEGGSFAKAMPGQMGEDDSEQQG